MMQGERAADAHSAFSRAIEVAKEPNGSYYVMRGFASMLMGNLADAKRDGEKAGEIGVSDGMKGSLKSLMSLVGG